MSAWYNDKSYRDDVVLSTRIRFARNVKGIPFASKVDEQGRKKVSELVFNALDASSLEFNAFSMDKTGTVDKRLLMERHMVSPQLIEDNGITSKEAYISLDEEVSVMTNEEDHIRIQCIKSGLSIKEAYELAKKVDILLEEKIEYAYNDTLGYLTSCPTNTGTGMRCSVMMHLPSIVMTKQMENLVNAVSKLGIAVRGLYGEGTTSNGCFYQISNQVTLGVDEEQIIAKMEGIVNQIRQRELECRQRLIESSGIKLEDRVSRAYGVLKYAKTMSSGEMKQLLSDVRLGVYMGTIGETDLVKLNRILVETEPAGIINHFKKSMNAKERDEKRCDLIRQIIEAKE